MPGKVAAILRREGIYASQLKRWPERKEHSLLPKKRGPKSNPLASENKKLKEDNLRLQKKLRDANLIIYLQKQVAEILGTSLQQLDTDD